MLLSSTMTSARVTGRASIQCLGLNQKKMHLMNHLLPNRQTCKQSRSFSRLLNFLYSSKARQLRESNCDLDHKMKRTWDGRLKVEINDRSLLSPNTHLYMTLDQQHNATERSKDFLIVTTENSSDVMESEMFVEEGKKVNLVQSERFLICCKFGLCKAWR